MYAWCEFQLRQKGRQGALQSRPSQSQYRRKLRGKNRRGNSMMGVLSPSCRCQNRVVGYDDANPIRSQKRPGMKRNVTKQRGAIHFFFCSIPDGAHSRQSATTQTTFTKSRNRHTAKLRITSDLTFAYSVSHERNQATKHKTDREMKNKYSGVIHMTRKHKHATSITNNKNPRSV